MALKVVSLMEPSLCIGCRFNVPGNVKMSDGSVIGTIRCLRLDCDNWMYETAQPAEIVEDSHQDDKG